ncbi:hypothetical protein V2K91_25425 [Pseudomonas alliivorans]|nr:hypothetical protein [Pseudomonas alliivorans]
MPEAITDDELIVRSVRKNWLKRGELQYPAFRPSAGKTLISVIRGKMGVDFCKTKSVEILAAEYVGLATILAGDIRALEALVEDYPQDFVGHAHIDHIDPPLPPNDPLSPAVNKVLNDRCKALARKAKFHADDEPEILHWTGSAILEAQVIPSVS